MSHLNRIYCYITTDKLGVERLMGITYETGVCPLIALNKEAALEMEETAREVAKKRGLTYRLVCYVRDEECEECSGSSLN